MEKRLIASLQAKKGHGESEAFLTETKKVLPVTDEELQNGFPLSILGQ